MMQADQNCLFIKRDDPCNAVIYDRSWLTEQLAVAGLRLTGLYPPRVRGFQWMLRLARVDDAHEAVELSSVDREPVGLMRSPNVANAASVQARSPDENDLVR
jgi:hypothetical protein